MCHHKKLLFVVLLLIVSVASALRAKLPLKAWFSRIQHCRYAVSQEPLAPKDQESRIIAFSSLITTLCAIGFSTNFFSSKLESYEIKQDQRLEVIVRNQDDLKRQQDAFKGQQDAFKGQIDSYASMINGQYLGGAVSLAIFAGAGNVVKVLEYIEKKEAARESRKRPVVKDDEKPVVKDDE